MDEPGQRVGRRRPAGAAGAGSEGAQRRGAPSEEALRRLIAAWASDVQTGVPADAAEEAALDGRLLQCEIGGGAFAFPLAAVAEVVPYTPPRRLPGQPAEAGVTMLRGQALPTLDAAARMGMAAETDGRMVVLTTAAGPCAVIVGETGDIVEVAPERMATPPTGAGASGYVAALVEIEGVLVAVLDPKRLCQG